MDKTQNSKKGESKIGFSLDNLPDDLRISTMTITCNLNTLIDIQNVGKYIDLSFGSIVCVKYKTNNNKMDDNTVIRSLIKIKKTRQKNKKKSKRQNFNNQATLVVDVKNKRTVNVKIFKNGAIQMTGCKSIDDFNHALNIVCSELKKKKAVYEKQSKSIIPKYFVSNHESVEISKVTNFKIVMINSNFNVGFLIDREKLHGLLIKSGVRSILEPNIHACVNIKFNYKNKDIISVFVFESGSIIITGAKTENHIIEAYKFITKILFENYDTIVKNNVESFLERDDVKQLIDEINKQQKEPIECSN